MYREEWLDYAVQFIALSVSPPIPADAGWDVGDVSVSVGWGPNKRSKQHAVVIDGKDTADGKPALFVSPTIGTSEDAFRAIADQLRYVSVGKGVKQSGAVLDGQWNNRVGLVKAGKVYTSGPKLLAMLADFIADTGVSYEEIHSKVTLSESAGVHSVVGKQQTYHKKASCQCCGFTMRITGVHIKDLKEAIAAGAPSCPLCFTGHPKCTGLCKQDQQQGGGSSGASPDMDLTPNQQPPSGLSSGPTPGQSSSPGTGGNGQSQQDEETGSDQEDQGQSTGPTGNTDSEDESADPNSDGQSTGTGGGSGQTQQTSNDGAGSTGNGKTTNGGSESSQQSGPVSQSTSGSGSGAGSGGGFGTISAPAKRIVQRAKVHRRDLCPFGDNCPECERDN